MEADSSKLIFQTKKSPKMVDKVIAREKKQLSKVDNDWQLPERSFFNHLKPNCWAVRQNMKRDQTKFTSHAGRIM